MITCGIFCCPICYHASRLPTDDQIANVVARDQRERVLMAAADAALTRAETAERRAKHREVQLGRAHARAAPLEEEYGRFLELAELFKDRDITVASVREEILAERAQAAERIALLEEKAEQMVTAIAGRPSESQLRAYPVLKQAEEFHRRAFNELRAALASKKGE